ncbi:MAG: hypothetical protein ACI8ZM_002099 [Crocinitomix sp.]|jgi:hypothetical protein
MRRNCLFYLLILISFYGCSNTSYWTVQRELPQGRILPCEIQITDSTYTICSYNENSNRGEIEVFNVEFKGDTLLVYDVLHLQKTANSDTIIYKSIIVEAYVIKGRRLYPIYWKYPTIYPKPDFKYFYSEDQGYLGKRDKSQVKKFSIDWRGTQNDYAYTNSKGIYHKREKYSDMRELIRNNNNASDSTLWEIKLPTKYISDTSTINLGWSVKHGTLKSKKGKFIDLR